MTNAKTTSLLLCLTVFLVLFATNSAGNATEKKCEVKKERGVIIDIKKSKVSNKNAAVVSGLNSSSEAKCQETCCKKEQCNIFIFSESKNGHVNCFLIDCKPPESCVRKNFSNSVVGVVKKPLPVTEPSTAKSVTTVINITSTAVTSSTTKLSTSPHGKKHKASKPSHEPHNHTTKASLVIALCFGFLFLFAVIVLVGRPWLHFLQRPRYSKMDYLMNGL